MWCQQFPALIFNSLSGFYLVFRCNALIFRVVFTNGLVETVLIFQAFTARADRPGIADVVLSCDNALPHLLTDSDLDLSLRNIRAKMKSKGLFLASLRDYDVLAQNRPRSTPPQVMDGEAGRRIVFQVWDWNEDGRTYQVHLFLLRQVGGSWQTVERVTRYRALRREELTDRLREAGFSVIHWHLPEQSGFFQPVVTAC